MVLAQLYLKGKVSASGDLLVVARFADALNSSPAGPVEQFFRKAVRSLWARLGLDHPFANSLRHYGTSARFYGLFLDDYMQYTCGLWDDGVSLAWPSSIEDAQAEINAAQIRKMDLIAAWLAIQEGNRLLDVGCGWGGLCGYLTEAKRIQAWGVTNSPSQADFAREFVRRRGGKTDRIICGDFMDVPATEKFDALTIVGMLEHVPSVNRDIFFAKMNELLKPGGRIYLQSIMQSPRWTGGDGTRFLQKYVFPGYTLEPADEVKARARRAGFEVSESEFREDHEQYGRTALLWLYRIAGEEKKVVQESDERTYRIMTAYLSVGSLIFGDGRGSVCRMLLYKPSVPSELKGATEDR
jgi:cyclopropane-fatty-acyl-phospholipid synthase